MGEVQITWVQNEQFVATDSTKHSIVLSTASDGTGSKPSDLLLIALGACAAVDVVNILAKKRQQFTDVHINVCGEQDPEPPWTFRNIHVQYTVKGRGISDKAVEQAIELAEDKYCSVASTLRGGTEITSSFSIVEDTSE